MVLSSLPNIQITLTANTSSFQRWKGGKYICLLECVQCLLSFLKFICEIVKFRLSLCTYRSFSCKRGGGGGGGGGGEGGHEYFCRFRAVIIKITCVSFFLSKIGVITPDLRIVGKIPTSIINALKNLTIDQMPH